ncbi:hypothetical protein Ccrd_022282 [Cynara cardunculus var. scolymus]|uniref:Peptidase C48, SUMO/Sentrin/Ubl1 n=1 Tax=Cynara cardunculus var. scolymus TaxID=59895 RepID=A0A103XZ02_CYNCS|nr:hypothetical protein Ccrd_022282 [Cynara cardunculus var. scolymus]
MLSQTDTKLRSKCINHNTQYALFSKGLLSSAKNSLEVIEMRNIDLQRLMIRHLNAVGHPAGRELDEIGQEMLRMDWQTQNNFDDCGVFAMRHMETYMGDVRTWKTGLAQ